MEEQLKEMDVLQGSPRTIKIGGKDITIKRLNLKNQMLVCELFMNAGDENNTMQAMGKVVQIATGMPADKFDETALLHELPDAFKIIWEQNEFGFLLQKVGSLKGLVPQAL